MPDHERLSKRLDALKNRAAGGQRVYRSEINDLAASAADLERNSDSLEARAALQVTEPPIYGGSAGQHSYFADMMRVACSYGEGDGGQHSARKRLFDHEAWQHRANERRLAAVTAEAEYAAERALSQSPAEARLYQRWRAAGGELFERQHTLDGLEQRATSRDPGQGGSFVPPGWLVEDFIHAPRAGAPFAALWASLPLPPHIGSVNLPRFQVGSRVGMQTADNAPVGTIDPQDGYLGATVLTLAANIDVSMQWLDLSPVPPDDTIGADLAEAFAANLDGQLLLGSGVNGQLPGIIPAGVFSAANMVWLSNTNNTTSQTWSNGGTNISQSAHEMTAQLKRKISRYRALPPTHWIAPGSLFDMISGSAADSQNRPLVTPGMHGPASAPMLHGLPIIADENIVETFGGTTPPVMGAVTTGLYAPVNGNGTWIPVICGRWKDCLYFQGDPVVQIMPEVISGMGQVRFQVRCYVAAAPGRVIFAGTTGSFSGTDQAGGLNQGASVSYGAMTNFVSNSPLQPAAAGY